MTSPLMLLAVLPTPRGPRYRVAPGVPHERFDWTWTEGTDYEITPAQFEAHWMKWAKEDEAKEMIAQFNKESGE